MASQPVTKSQQQDDQTRADVIAMTIKEQEEEQEAYRHWTLTSILFSVFEQGSQRKAITDAQGHRGQKEGAVAETN